MSTFEDAARIALALPGTQELTSRFRVDGKNFAAVYPERVEGHRGRVPNFGVLVVWVPDLHTKEALLASDPAIYFTTDHYDGYASVLVRLERVDEQLLTELLSEAWRSRAPKNLLDEER